MKINAPVGGGNNKLETPLTPAGMQLAIIVGFAHVGTQDTKFGEKERFLMALEFPQFKDVFYEGGDPQPHMIFCQDTFSMAPKSNLKSKFVDLAEGKVLSEAEAKDYDLSSLVGKVVVANVTHSSDAKYANVNSLSTFTDQHKRLFGIADVNTLRPESDTFLYHTSAGFEGAEFTSLYGFIQEKIKTSTEGKAFQAGGGVFAEAKKETGSSSKSTSSSTSSAKSIKMVDGCDYSYEDLKAAGWTDQAMVDSKYAVFVEATPPPTPAPAAAPAPTPTPVAPAAPSAPVAPPIVAAPASVAPTAPVLTMNDPTAVLADWLSQGWTEETLIANGHASMK
jgi:hypothetical protein